MSKKYAIFLNGEQISPSFDTELEAKEWGMARYGLDDERVSIQFADED